MITHSINQSISSINQLINKNVTNDIHFVHLPYKSMESMKKYNWTPISEKVQINNHHETKQFTL